MNLSHADFKSLYVDFNSAQKLTETEGEKREWEKKHALQQYGCIKETFTEDEHLHFFKKNLCLSRSYKRIRPSVVLTFTHALHT